MQANTRLRQWGVAALIIIFAAVLSMTFYSRPAFAQSSGFGAPNTTNGVGDRGDQDSFRNFIGNSKRGPDVMLTASPAAIAKGEMTTLTWSSTNAIKCFGVGFVVNGTSGSRLIKPPATMTFSLICIGSGGFSAKSVTVKVTGRELPPTLTLSAEPMSIKAGQSTTLKWQSTHAKSCTGTNFTPGSKTGKLKLKPTTTTTYSITCTGDGGSTTRSVTVKVDGRTPPPPPPAVPTITLNANPSSITSGNSFTLTWDSTDATSCVGTNFTAGGTSGSIVLDPTTTTTYSITCTGAGGSATKSVTETVTIPTPTVTLSSDPSNITAGQSATLSWTSANADSCTGSGFTVNSLSGSVSIAPVATTTYSIVCTGTNGGTANASVTVGVTPVVQAAVLVTLTANPAAIDYGDVSVLTWDSTNANSCTGSGFTTNGTSGSAYVSPTVTTTYSVTCTNGSSSGSASVTLTINVPPPIALLAAPQIAPNEQITTIESLNVRSAPDISGGKKNIVCKQPAGASGTVVSGPETQNDITWWNVSYDSGCSGWSSQDYLATAVTFDSRQAQVAAAVDSLSTLESQLNGFLGQIKQMISSLRQ